jgi:RelE toxin of RelE / RelB toxin-antitoxin system
VLTIVETPLFSKLVFDYLTDDEFAEFQFFLAENPEAGDVVPGSGGVRKIRWARRGMGKSGGTRIIYFNRLSNSEIWLLTIYAKAKQENAPAHILKAMKEAIENDP